MIPASTAAGSDRFGLGWRRELAVGILSHLDRIDVVEVMADDFFDAPRRERRSLRTLAAQTSVVLHGVSLGVASSAPVETERLDKIARLCAEVEPQFWSEHLAFVRGGGIEIGHLTAPPRTLATVEGAAANLNRARSIVGTAPLVENIATLIDPPGSDRDEVTWISEILATSDCPMLLDLHNLYANGLNFGADPMESLAQLPNDPYGADGLTGMKKLIKKNRNIHPDLQITIEDQIAEGDKVATRWIATMTHSGKVVTLKGITIDRFENDKIVEAWRSMDMLGLLQQTGAVARTNE